MSYFRTALAVCASAIVTTIAVSQPNIPHIFVAGQPARASDVNENFEALNDAIQALRNQQSIGGINVVDANGMAFGTVTQCCFSSGSVSTFALVPINANGVQLVLNLPIRPDGLERSVNYMRYLSADCTGQAYMADQGTAFPGAAQFSFNGLTGEVFISLGPPDPNVTTAGSYLYLAPSGSSDPTTTACGNMDFDPTISTAYPVDLTLEFYTLHPPPYALGTSQ